jgi:hypothetical protein
VDVGERRGDGGIQEELAGGGPETELKQSAK